MHVSRLEAQMGRSDEALKAAQELIVSAPGNTDHYEFYAQTCFRLGKTDEGLEALRKAVRINPNEPHLIMALGSALAGSDRPLVITSGTGMGNSVPGQPATEDVFNSSNPHPRKASELAGASMLAAGVNVTVVRLPQVHDPVKQGLITPAVAIAREKGVSAYVGDGRNRWPAAHVLDVARLYRLALEKREAGSRYHAVAEEGVSVRDIAEVIGRGLKVPVVAMSPHEVAGHFGWLAGFVGMDIPASSARTQKALGWHPTGPGLIADLEQMRYFDA